VKKIKKITSGQEQEAQILQQIKNKLISREKVFLIKQSIRRLQRLWFVWARTRSFEPHIPESV